MSSAVKLRPTPRKLSGNYHVLPDVKGWVVKGENSRRAVAVYGTQLEAIRKGRELTRGRERKLVIHGLDGRIRSVE